MKCNPGVEKLIKEVMRMNERLDIFEDCMRKVDDKTEKMREALSSQVDKALTEVNKSMTNRLKDNEIRNLIHDEMKKFEDKVIENKPLLSKMISKEVESRFTEINDDIDLVQKTVTETKEKIMDNEDKLKRLNNIIMYNVEESKADIALDRNVDDMQFCGSVMEQVLRVGYEKGDIVKLVRLGRYEYAKKRPLLIEFSNGHVENVVMENFTKLSSAKDRFEGITISHDMTIKKGSNVESSCWK